MKRILFIALGFIAFSASAQDLTGIWRGSFNSGQSKLLEALGQDGRYKFEVQIAQNDKIFEAVTYSYLSTVFYGKAVSRGTFNPKTQKALLEELKIVELRMSDGSNACIMTCFLQYSKNGNEEFLEGTYSSMNTNDSTNCGKGTIYLRRVITSDFYKEPFVEKREKEIITGKKNPPVKPVTPEKNAPVAEKNGTDPVKKPVTKPAPPVTGKKTGPPAQPKPAPKQPKAPPPIAKNPVNPPATLPKPVQPNTDTIKKAEVKAPLNMVTPKVLVSRENELVKTIVTGANEIIVNIYDNGSIDNDTISVYLDKKLVLSKKRLTDKAITLTFKLNDDESVHELVMVAENLGEIPPNTSLMVVKAGSKQYEVRITSTEQKNAVIAFKYQKE